MAFSRVQSKTVTKASGASFDSTFNSTPAAGNLIIVAVSSAGLNAVATGVTDNQTGNTYIQVGSAVADASGNNIQIFFAQNVASTGTFTITTTFGGATVGATASIFEYSGAATVGALLANTTGTGTSTTPASASLTPGENNCLVIAALADSAGDGTTITAGTNFTLEESQLTSSTLQRIGVEDWIQTSASASTGDFTLGSSVAWATKQAIFRPAIPVGNMSSVIFGGQNTAANGTVNNYDFITAAYTSLWTTSETNRETVIPITCTLNNLYVQTSAAPGGTTLATFSVMQNGTQTNLGVTISGAGTSGSDITNSVVFQAGDSISMQSAPSGTPTMPANVWWNLTAVASSNMQPIPGGNATPTVNNATAYTGIFSGRNLAWSATETDFMSIAPTAGTFSKLYLSTAGGPGAGKSYVVTLMVNGGTTALSGTVSGTAQTGNDLTDTVVVNPGDTISLQEVPSGTPTARAIRWGIAFSPVTNGESIYGFGHELAPNTTLTNNEQAYGDGAHSYSTVESTRQSILGAYTVKNFYAQIMTAPGGTATRTITLRKASADTALTVTITGAGTTANVASNVSYSQGDMINIQTVPSGTPAALTGGVHAGWTVFIQPPVGAASLIPFRMMQGIGY